MLLALGVLAMTVGLIRSEAAADVRTLTATGATSGTRRMLTAATAGALAFLGVVLGTGGAYIALMAGHVRDLAAESGPSRPPRRDRHRHTAGRGRCGMAARRTRAQRARPSGRSNDVADDIGRCRRDATTPAPTTPSPEDGRRDGGGAPARRAVVRWAWRLFRREWRQQALVVGLLTVTVGAAITLSAAAYNTVGVPENAVFGSANHRFEVDEPNLLTLPGDLSAAGERFGAVDVIARWSRAVPGSVESVEYRAQDPGGPFSAPILALRGGRYPNAVDEVAITDGIVDMLQIGVGDELGLDGHLRTVVGTIENPSDLNSEFVLVAPGHDDLVESLTILIGGTGVFDEVRAIRDFGADHLPNADVTTRGDVENVQAAAAVLGVAQVVLVLVALVAVAGFITVAQRRLRQLGMLAAVGATERHLRLVVVANGAVVGVVGAVLGAVMGMVAWTAVAPRMENAVGFRIDRFNVPWWLIVTAMVLAVVTATCAAWWPARTVARVPITSALSGRPPEAAAGAPLGRAGGSADHRRHRPARLE